MLIITPHLLSLFVALLLVAVGLGNAGDGVVDQPDYDVPDDALDVDDDPSPQPPQGAQPPSQPSATARPGQPLPDDPGGQPTPGTAGQPGQPPTHVTYERFHQAITRNQQLAIAQQQAGIRIATLEAQVRALTGVQPPAGGPAKPAFNESEEKARATMLRLLPGLDQILKHADKLSQVPEFMESATASDSARLNHVATQIWSGLDLAVSGFYGIASIDELDPFARKMLDDGFVNWLQSDASAAARYLAGDTTIGAEYFTKLQTGFLTPAQARVSAPPQPGGGAAPQPRPAVRPGQPPALAGRRPTPPVPRGGAGAGPVGQRPAQPSNKTPDAVHDAAADAFFAQGTT